jgi:hypothetical protein
MEVTMQLELTGDDAAVLADVLRNAISDLSPEIADTDNAEYRRGLRTRREQLQRLLDGLTAAV